MEQETKISLMQATISKFVAERDEAYYTIKSILDGSHNSCDDNVVKLKKAFEKMSIASRCIEEMQIIYAKEIVFEDKHLQKQRTKKQEPQKREK